MRYVAFIPHSVLRQMREVCPLYFHLPVSLGLGAQSNGTRVTLEYKTYRNVAFPHFCFIFTLPSQLQQPWVGSNLGNLAEILRGWAQGSNGVNTESPPKCSI